MPYWIWYRNVDNVCVESFVIHIISKQFAWDFDLVPAIKLSVLCFVESRARRTLHQLHSDAWVPEEPRVSNPHSWKVRQHCWSKRHPIPIVLPCSKLLGGTWVSAMRSTFQPTVDLSHTLDICLDMRTTICIQMHPRVYVAKIKEMRPRET